MCEPTVIMATMAASTALSAYSMIQQGNTAAAVGRNNQIMAEYAAQDAERRGEDAAVAAGRRASQVRGAQRAALGARGLDLESGTAAEIQDQTDFFGQTDVATARNNGRREAWSDRAQGAAARFSGDSAQQQSQLAAASTILGSAGKVAGSWYSASSAGYNYNNDAGGSQYSASGLDIRARR